MSTDPTKNELSISNPRASAYDADLEREVEAALGGLTVEDLESYAKRADKLVELFGDLAEISQIL